MRWDLVEQGLGGLGFLAHGMDLVEPCGCALWQWVGQGGFGGQLFGVQAFGKHHADGVLPCFGRGKLLPQAWGLRVVGGRPKIVGRAAVQDLGDGLLLGLRGDVLLIERLIMRLLLLLLRFQAA